MRIIAIFGWLCFALDAAFVVALLVMSDVGSDAAGRGLGRGWGVMLLPILLAAGGLLYWGTKSRSSFGVLTGTLMVALPFILLANNKIKQLKESADYYARLAEHGQFADGNLNALVKAIDAGDTTVLKSLLDADKTNGVVLNYTQRDKAGATLLGFAVSRATEYNATPDKVASLRLLLQNGVPYAADAVSVNDDWGVGALMTGGDQSIELSAIALDAGANPNARASYEKYPVILAYQVNVAKLKLLVQHGADVQAKNQLGESTLMSAIRFKKFPEALFFLEQGVDPDYASPDGRTARSELDRAVKEAANYHQPMDPGYDEFVKAFVAREGKGALKKSL